MEYRTLGTTNLKLSAVTFGAWAAGGWMWGGSQRKSAIEAIKAGFDEGVTSIDTAPVYGQGESEEIVGEAIAGIPRDKVQILTKFGMRWDIKKGSLAFSSKDNQGNDIDIYKYAGKESIVRELEESLRRLKTDYIDLYQIHWPEVTTPIEETMEIVTELIKAGKVRQAGVCNYDVSQMQEAAKFISLASNQVSYSMVLRGIEKDLVPYCIENKQSILAYSPMARGLLTGKIKPGHKFAEGDHRAQLPYYQDDTVKRVGEMLDKIRPLAEEKKASLSQLVLRWTLDRPGITIVLAGARDKEQAVQNAKAASLKLSKDELALITSQVDKLSQGKRNK